MLWKNKKAKGIRGILSTLGTTIFCWLWFKCLTACLDSCKSGRVGIAASSMADNAKQMSTRSSIWAEWITLNKNFILKHEKILMFQTTEWIRSCFRENQTFERFLIYWRERHVRPDVPDPQRTVCMYPCTGCTVTVRWCLLQRSTIKINACLT